MTIVIDTKDILFDMKDISHMELANIEDMRARYNIEAGTDKEEELYRDIENAEGMARLQFDRFLERVNKIEDLNGFPVSYEFTFKPSLRRQEFREDIYRELLRQAIVNVAMAYFYNSVSQAELSQKHNAEAQSNFTTLEKMFFDKRAPKLPKA